MANAQDVRDAAAALAAKVDRKSTKKRSFRLGRKVVVKLRLRGRRG